MPVRNPAVAGMFYPDEPDACRAEVQACLRDIPSVDVPRPILTGMAPHAGWAYSGPTAARVFAAIAAQGAPQTLVLFGAVHRWGVPIAAVFGAGSWRTPLGDVAIDSELAGELLRGAPQLVADQPQAHREEHSIEVQLPFVRYLFPEARILPIAVPPEAQPEAVGRAAATAVRALGRQAVAVASSDMTHYGPRYGMAPAGTGEAGLRWTRANDARMLALVVKLQAGEVVAEAEAHGNACGAGAIAAAIAYARELGASEGRVLQYTTSHDARPMGRPSDAVGYGAVILF